MKELSFPLIPEPPSERVTGKEVSSENCAALEAHLLRSWLLGLEMSSVLSKHRLLSDRFGIFLAIHLP